MCAREFYTNPGTRLLQACSAHLTSHINGHFAAHPQKLHTAAHPVSQQCVQETHQPIHSTTQPMETQPMDVQGDREGRPYCTSASPLQHDRVKWAFRSYMVGAGFAPLLPSPLAPALVSAVVFPEHPLLHVDLRFDNAEPRKT